MWSVIRWLVLRIAAIRWLFKLGWLGALFPIALLLKSIGLPLLGILGVVAGPLLILLFLFGLPLFLVFGVAALVIGLLAVTVIIGLAALKFFIFVVLPVVLMFKLARWLWCRIFKRGDGGTTPPPPTPGPDMA